MSKRVLAFCSAFVFALSSILAFLPATPAHAAFNANRIIDDLVFDRVSSMTAGQIDAFLNSFPSSCISTNRGFGAVDPIGYSPSAGYKYGGVVSAGTVIAHAAQAYGINPQVLIATLQKEQSLVTGTAGCTVKRYTAAMGYGCPDNIGSYSYSGVHLYSIGGVAVTSVSDTCVNSASKAGFAQQVIRAAWLLKFGQQRSKGNIQWAVIQGQWDNSDDPQSCYSGPMTAGTWKVCPSGSYVYYDGLRSIDNTTVSMESGATAALYWFTPHLHGNQLFYDTFTGWFGGVYADDTDVAHPDGTLVVNAGSVYLINSGRRSLITNGGVFESHGFLWTDIRKATTGDMNLPAGGNLDTLAPGTVFSYDNGPVYIVDFFNGQRKKQWLSYTSFIALGYTWGQVMQLPANQVPAETEPGVYTSTRHPNGNLIASNGKVYFIDTNTRRHVLNGYVFDSYDYRWDRVLPATAADSEIPIGAPLDFNPGTVLFSNGIYTVEYDMAGIFKRPVGPWECYHDRLHYQTSDWYEVPPPALPVRTGTTYTC